MPKKVVQKRPLAISLAGLLTLPLCHAEQRPLWEAGIGIGAISLPDYRGSDSRQTYVLPAPYVVYRGDFFRADREGVRSTLFKTDRVEVNVSVGATLPVNSRDNEARRGMADLKPTVEIGPTLDITLWESPDEKMKLDFRAPLRTGVTVQSSPKQVGWILSPNLNLDIRDPAGMAGWNLGLLAGPLFSTRQYNARFYSVSAAEATAARPAYNAPGGYAGSQFTVALSKRFPGYWVGSYARYDTLAGAAFEDSPMVKQRNNVSAGFAISWVFGESSTMVDVED